MRTMPQREIREGAPLSQIDIDKLTAIALSATPGPWKVFDKEQPFYVWDEAYETYVASCWVSDGPDRAAAAFDAAYIAAANPATVLALLSEVRALRESVATIIDAYDGYRGRGILPAPDEYQPMVQAIEAARVISPSSTAKEPRP